MNKPHVPVLLQEVITALSLQEGGLYVDATFGAGGYSQGILSNKDCNLVAVDRDPSVIEFVHKMEAEYLEKFQFISGEFGNIKNLINFYVEKPIDGIVFDIGVSSMQLDQQLRGFSFSKDAPLDMRMDTRKELTAHDIVNSYDEKSLANLLFNYGGEKKSRRIAAAMLEKRAEKPIETTIELANIIKAAVGKYNDTIHPATRSFQAIRMQVNDEIGQLQSGLEGAAQILKPNGVMVVVTFHSVEDKVVKDYFKKLAGIKVNANRHLPTDSDLEPVNYELVYKKVITADAKELKSNPRARSAKLRAIRRLR